MKGRLCNARTGGEGVFASHSMYREEGFAHLRTGRRSSARTPRRGGECCCLIEMLLSDWNSAVRLGVCLARVGAWARSCCPPGVRAVAGIIYFCCSHVFIEA